MRTSTIVRPDLATLVYEYSESAASSGFIAQRAMPPFKVPEQSGQFPVLPAKVFMEIQDTARAPRSAYPRGDWEFTWDSYTCREFGWEEHLDDAEANLYAKYFDAEEIAVKRATLILMRGLEKRVADILTNDTVFSKANATAKWDQYATADPLSDVLKAKARIKDATGLEPNTLIMNDVALRHISQCDAVIDRIKYTNPNVVRGELPDSLLKAYFGIQKILVSDAMFDGTGRNKSASLSRIWPDAKVMVCRTSEGNDVREPALGRILIWQRDANGIYVTEQYREEQTRSNVYRVRQYVAERVQCAACGTLITQVL